MKTKQVSNDINLIARARSTPRIYLCSVVIRANDMDVKPTHLVSIDTLRDYNNNYGDYIVVDLLMGNGDFQYDVLPYKDNLTAVINYSIDGRNTQQQYKAVILNNKGNGIGNLNRTASRDDLNNIGLVHVTMQCIDLAVEALRGTNVYGIRRNTTVKDTILSKINETLDSISLGGEKLKASVNLAEPDNIMFYDHITIEPGITIFDLPVYLQETSYGVYNGGIGVYFQRDLNGDGGLYIYSQNSKDSTDTMDSRMIIYSVDTDKYDTIESTYIMDGDILKVIAGSNKKGIDTGEAEMMNTGISYVSVNPDRIMQRNVIKNEDGILISSNANVVVQSMADRADSSVKHEYVGVTTNMFKHRSEAVSKSMAPILFTWNNCDPDLIYPSMAVVFTYNDSKTGTTNLFGSISSCFYKYDHKKRSYSALLVVTVTKANFYKYTGLKDEVYTS